VVQVEGNNEDAYDTRFFPVRNTPAVTSNTSAASCEYRLEGATNQSRHCSVPNACCECRDQRKSNRYLRSPYHLEILLREYENDVVMMTTLETHYQLSKS
jgi:hypothetical protein